MTSKWSQDSYIKAYRFAANAHAGQLFPGTELPYIMHISFVAMEITAVLANKPGLDGNLAVQCALLHDTIEDTDTTCKQLVDNFSRKVADGVSALTKDKSMEAGLTDKFQIKKLKIADSLARIRKQPQEIWMVKMADRITNLHPPPSHWDKVKIQHYREESIVIHETLKGASPFLAERLKTKINEYLEYSSVTSYYLTN